VPVADACNPSYSGGREQEYHSSNPAWENSSLRPYLKEHFIKIGLVEWFKVKALKKKVTLFSPLVSESGNRR
jgi:hypothetical protein